MKYTKLKNTNLKVSKICLGTMTWGQQNTEKEAHEQLDYAISEGINFIDTAEAYPVPIRKETSNTTEKYIGSWLKHQDRSKLILATKIVGPGRFEHFRGGPRIIKNQIHEAIKGSLKRLQTDYIDIYQIHWPDRYVPIFGQEGYNPSKRRESEPILEQLLIFDNLIKEGKIRYLGLSNETPWGVMKFTRIAKEQNLPYVATIQNAYNLMNRTFENGLDEVAYETGVYLLAYSPLAFGWLSGKHNQRITSNSRLALFENFGIRYDKTNVKKAVLEYQKIADKYQLSLTQLALSFVNSRWFLASNIVGATTMKQLKENLSSIKINFSEEIEHDINQIHQIYKNPAP